MKASILTIVTIVSLGSEVDHSRAAVAFTIDTTIGIPDTATGNDAIKFTPTSTIVVDALGYYDLLHDGFQFSHPVGIFDYLSHVLLASATITTSDTLIDDFRYASITPITLAAGRSYVVVGHATASSVDRTAACTVFGVNSLVTFDGYSSNYDSTLTCPTTGYNPPQALFGPNFNISVPETSTPLLTTIGLVGILVRRVRHRPMHG